MALSGNESILAFYADALTCKVFKFLLQIREIIIVINSQKQLSQLRRAPMGSILIRAQRCEYLI